MMCPRNEIELTLNSMLEGNPHAAPRDLVEWISRQVSGAFGVRLLSVLADEAAGASKDAAFRYLRETSRIASICGRPTVEMDGDEPVVSISSVVVEMVGGEVVHLMVDKDAVEACYLGEVFEFVDDMDTCLDQREHDLERLSRYFGVSSWDEYWSVLYGLIMTSTESVEIVVDKRLPRRSVA